MVSMNKLVAAPPAPSTPPRNVIIINGILVRLCAEFTARPGAVHAWRGGWQFHHVRQGHVWGQEEQQQVLALLSEIHRTRAQQ